MDRPIHPDFQHHLDFKNGELIDLYTSLRTFLLTLAPDSNELLYHTHALTSVYTLSKKLSDGFCHIPIYNQHLNLGFNKGVLLPDPKGLLQGTGKLIRHIPIQKVSDFKNKPIEKLVIAALALSQEDLEVVNPLVRQTISKIKKA